ncbi:MAG: aspartate kinase [Candidatus Riflebacteria bacterium]|nr:aspartate kinase [Candidatus Riflebacteria bacterium]
MFEPGDVLVQKYGGSSVATPERIIKVAERISEFAKSGKRVAVVVSAMGDTTDDLIKLMHAIDRDPDLRELDQLMATGEMVSASLLASALRKIGVNARSFNAFNLQIETDGKFSSAEVLKFRNVRSISEFLKPGSVAVVAGFQGISQAGDLTTLGRGGSDITAVALASELGQKVCEKLTDENGIYSADPREIHNPVKIWHLNYDEMKTLSVFGNGILHPRAIDFARKYDIRIHVRSSFTSEEGSIIGPLGDESIPLKSISCEKKQAVVSIENVSRVLENSDNVLPLTLNELRKVNENRNDLRFAFRFADAFEVMPHLWQKAVQLYAEDLIFNADLSMFSVVGCGISNSTKYAAKINEALSENGIETIISGCCNLRYTVAVPSCSSSRTMEILHKTLVALNDEK